MNNSSNNPMNNRNINNDNGVGQRRGQDQSPQSRQGGDGVPQNRNGQYPQQNGQGTRPPIPNGYRQNTSGRPPVNGETPVGMRRAGQQMPRAERPLANKASGNAPKNPKRKASGGIGSSIKALKEKLTAFFKKNEDAYHQYLGIKQKTAALFFAVMSVAIIACCSYSAYSYVGESIKVQSNNSSSAIIDSKEYYIVYSPQDSFGADAAGLLAESFFEKTGVRLKTIPDTENQRRHEICIGHTNRSYDDYIISASALGLDGYAVIITSNDSVSLPAFSRAGAEAAIEYFVSSYVGSYLGGELTFTSRMNFSYVSRTGKEPLNTLRETKHPLVFDEKGSFKVLVLSDADLNTYTLEAIDVILENEKPSLVIFAGDVSSGLTTKAELEAYLKELTSPIEKRKIPWSCVLGEQDIMGGLSAQQQMEVYTSFEYCVAKSELAVNGTVSHFLPIFASQSDVDVGAPVSGIWALGQTGMLSSLGGNFASEPIFEADRAELYDFGYVSSAQLAWVTEVGGILDREVGGKIPTFAVTHTPVEEFNLVYNNPNKTLMVGTKGEAVSSSPIHSGLFSTLVDRGGVMGLYCGHDHINTYSGRILGIELGYVSSIGYDGYGFGGTFTTNNAYRGGRLINLTLNDGVVSLSSRCVYAADYGVGRE